MNDVYFTDTHKIKCVETGFGSERYGECELTGNSASSISYLVVCKKYEKGYSQIYDKYIDTSIAEEHCRKLWKHDLK